MLTDYTIDVFRDIDAADEEDIYLDEFADEIDMWVIDALKNIGCNTAKAVLALSREEIMERADLEEQTVDDVLSILSSEFEDEEVSEPDFEPAEEEDSMDSKIDVPEPVSTEQDTENEEQEEEKE